MKQWLVAGSMVGAVVFGSQSTRVNAIVNPPVRIVGLEAQDSHAASSLLGQFRTNISSFLYLRSDLYVHGGVEMRPLTKDEEKHGRPVANEAHDEAEKLDGDEPIVTVIPSPKEDFRGIFGDVEREVSSYKAMEDHHHQKPVQALPLFRLMTWLDPQFIDGWTSASQIILWENKPNSSDLAVRFLQQGLDQNPQSIDLLGQIAYCHLRDRAGTRGSTKKYELALPYLERAKKIGLENLDKLSKDEFSALEENYRRLAVCYRELKKFELMKSIAAEGLKLFGQDASLRHASEEAGKHVH